MKNLKVAVLGAGSMGTAIIDGLIANGMTPSNISTLTNSAESALKLTAKYPINAFSLEDDGANNLATINHADVIILATKPYLIVESVSQLVEPQLNKDALIVSVAAGITCATIEAALPLGNPVVRAMPNTPAIVGKAITGIAAGSRANDRHLQLAVELFESIGKTLVLDESRIDALSTISGSGPAYVFFLVEKLIEAAKHPGRPVPCRRLPAWNRPTWVGCSQRQPMRPWPAHAKLRPATSPAACRPQRVACKHE